MFIHLLVAYNHMIQRQLLQDNSINDKFLSGEFLYSFGKVIIK